jgi:hypothetical protein
MTTNDLALAINIIAFALKTARDTLNASPQSTATGLRRGAPRRESL